MPSRLPSIPKKFKNTGKSFVEMLRPDSEKSQLSSFCAFPKGVEFRGKDYDESIVLMIRRDLAALIPQYFTIFFLFISPFLFTFIINGIADENTSSGVLIASSFIIFWLLTFTAIVDLFLKWFYSVGIITDQRVIDLDFNNVLYHRYSEAALERIEDVTHKVSGLIRSIFDFGDVYIQTAASTNEFEYNDVPRPRDVQDVIYDLIELKQEEEE